VFPLEITFKSKDRELTIFLKGELDHHGAKKVMRTIDELMELEIPRVTTLDLQHLSFMDSSGIAVLLRAYRRMNDSGGGLVVRNVPSQSLRVLQAAGLNRLISFC
jgi:stage II sporulation protein AA (anti-sigma F factor antagonist)